MDDERDWVRLEIATALKTGVPIIPLLVDGAKLPPPAELPTDIRDFAFRQAAILNTDVDFRSHTDRLIKSIDRLIADQRAIATRRPIAIPTPSTPEIIKRSPPTAKIHPKKVVIEDDTASDPQVSHTTKKWFKIIGFALIMSGITTFLEAKASTNIDMILFILRNLGLLVGAILLFIGFEPVVRKRTEEETTRYH